MLLQKEPKRNIIITSSDVTSVFRCQILDYSINDTDNVDDAQYFVVF